MRYIKALTVAAFFLTAGYVTAGTVPPLINYQGRLMDSGGMPVSVSTAMTFSLWDGQTAGTMLWSESKPVNVNVGLYSVILGDSVAIPSTVLSGSTVFLQVTVLGEALSPRERLTSVPYAMESDQLDGLDSTDFSLVGHTHDFSQITGTATDAQIPDNITINLAQNSTDLNGQPAAAYVLAAGDTVTGGLQVNGTIFGSPDLTIARNLTVSGGNLGLGTAPDPNYSIVNASSAPLYGAFLHGSSGGLLGVNTGDPDNYAVVGGTGSGVGAWAGSTSSLSARMGGEFYAQTQDNAYGVYSQGVGYGPYAAYGAYALGQSGSTADAYGVYGVGDNSSSGRSYGGYFANSNAGTGDHYGLFAEANTYPGYFAWSTDPANHYAELAVQGYGIYTQSGSATDGSFRGGGGFNSASSGPAVGVWANASGSGSNVATGVFGYGSNSADGTVYGGEFSTDPSGTGTHYGIDAEGYASSSSPTYGMYSYAGNDMTGDVYGGYFLADSTGTGLHYGVYGTSDQYGLYGAWSGDPVNNYAGMGSSNFGIITSAGTSSTTHPTFGGYFQSTSQDYSTGVQAVATGYGGNPTYAIYAQGFNYGTGDGYGAYLWPGSATANAYGLYVVVGTKNWVNPDPEDPGKSIVYSTVESGENVTYYSSRARLVDGRTVITLPDHFRKVTSPDYQVTVQLTPRYTHTLGLAVTESDNRHLVVEELMDGKGNFEFDYTVKGIRLGYEDYQPIINNVDYVPFQGNLSQMDSSKMTTQEFYDHEAPPGLKKIFEKNGTLEKDGKVNTALFKARGWKEVKHRAVN